jgi:hypothetical protein
MIVNASVCCYAKALEESGVHQDKSCCSQSQDGKTEEFPRHCSGCDLADGKLELSKADVSPDLNLYEIAHLEFLRFQNILSGKSFNTYPLDVLENRSSGRLVYIENCQFLI